MSLHTVETEQGSGHKRLNVTRPLNSYFAVCDYTAKEIVDMILITGECHGNYDDASKLYAERFSDRKHPRPRMIRHLIAEARKWNLV